jgi:hypothetical protein
MLVTWALTVLSEIYNSWAISLLLAPLAINVKTSFSLGERACKVVDNS